MMKNFWRIKQILTSFLDSSRVVSLWLLGWSSLAEGRDEYSLIMDWTIPARPNEPVRAERNWFTVVLQWSDLPAETRLGSFPSSFISVHSFVVRGASADTETWEREIPREYKSALVLKLPLSSSGAAYRPVPNSPDEDSFWKEEINDNPLLFHTYLVEIDSYREIGQFINSIFTSQNILWFDVQMSNIERFEMY